MYRPNAVRKLWSSRIKRTSRASLDLINLIRTGKAPANSRRSSNDDSDWASPVISLLSRLRRLFSNEDV